MQHLCLPHKSTVLLTCNVLQHTYEITLLIEHLVTLILRNALS